MGGSARLLLRKGVLIGCDISSLRDGCLQAQGMAITILTMPGCVFNIDATLPTSPVIHSILLTHMHFRQHTTYFPSTCQLPAAAHYNDGTS